MGVLLGEAGIGIEFENAALTESIGLAALVLILTEGGLTTPKSGKVRSVPMAPDVAAALARLGQRGYATDRDDLVFPGPFLDPETLLDDFEQEAVTITAGVPTIWMGILGMLDGEWTGELDHVRRDGSTLDVDDLWTDLAAALDAG